MKGIRILGVLLNIPLVQKKVSGSRSLVYEHLRSKGYIAGLVDPALRFLKRKMYFFKNISTDKNSWLLKLNLDVCIRHSISKNLKRKIDLTPYNFNIILQIGSQFHLHKIKGLENIPKFSYHDNNVKLYYDSGFDSIAAKNKWKYKRMFEKAFAFEKEVYDNLNGIFVYTDFHRNSFLRDFEQLEEKVHTIGFGCNIKEDLISDYEKDYSNRTILFVAKDSFKQKGGILLLEAFKKVRNKYKNAKLIILGPKKKFNIPNVEWIGFINKRIPDAEQRIINLYKKASLFVMPSFGEPAGVAFLEAMAFKLPIIGARQGATNAIVCDNKCGFVIKRPDSKELADKIIEMFENESLMELFGKNGIRAIQTKYNWNVVCRKAIEIISKFV